MNTRRGSGTRRLAEIRRVLIVDDNLDSAELLALLLRREGHETRLAHDGEEAIRVALSFCPNIAFLDIGLPGINGYELLAILRECPELPGCKFVAISGHDEPLQGQGEPEFDAYLRKPIDLDSVVGLVLEIAEPALSRPAIA